MHLRRRELLAIAPAVLAGCAVRRARVGVPPAPLLRRVNVAPDRLIRTTVGLRPYRPSGFVVRADKLDGRVVIHNYGHGGAGITLSWGTAQLAVTEAANVDTRQCAVIGCGVVGLSTARLLQERGYTVCIYSKAVPPDTTSNLAGGYWDPVTVYDRARMTPEFRHQFVDAARFAFRRYQSLVGDRFAVRWLPVYHLSSDSVWQPASPESAYSEIDPLYPEPRQLTRHENPFDVPYAQRRYSMLIEPAVYLQALLDEFFFAGGRVVVREFASIPDLLTIKETLIFNCTGLGARALFGDDELVPVRGQLEFLLPQPEINYMTVGPGDIYMFPRQDGILLGGSHDRGNWNLDPDPAITSRILRENAALFAAMRQPAS